MRTVYLSHILSPSTPQYGGLGGGINIVNVKEIPKGDTANTQEWRMSNHLGTHIDAPRHFIANGAPVAAYPAPHWICSKVAVAEVPLSEGRLIMPEDISSFPPPDAECILLKTGFEARRETPEYATANPGISPTLAEHLCRTFPLLRFVGMDFISVSSFKDREAGRIAHRILLSPEGREPVLPVEDMSLAPVGVGIRIARMIISPLRVAGSDGAPVTVLAEVE